MPAFKTTLFRYPGPGGWTFARVPARHAPPVTHGWGRTPVWACVDGQWWKTSVWRDKTHGTLLAVPKRLRSGKEGGDAVTVELRDAGEAAPVPASPARRPAAKRRPTR